MVHTGRIVAILKPGGTHVKNIVRTAREKGLLVSAAQGKKVRSAILTGDGYVFLSTLSSESLAGRLDEQKTQPGGKI